MTHQHAEAFKIMQYCCAHGHMEAIWNSRDGVTPFIVDCRACGTDAKHVNWRADRYDPTYDPPRGHRYFRDGRSEEARAIMRARIDSSAYNHFGNAAHGRPYRKAKETKATPVGAPMTPPARLC